MYGWCSPLSVDCIFFLVMQKVLKMRFHWSVLEVISCVNGALSEFHAYAHFMKYPPLIVSGLTLMSLIHLELIFVQGERYGDNFIFLHMDIQGFQLHFLKRMYVIIFFNIACFWNFVKIKWLQLDLLPGLLFHWPAHLLCANATVFVTVAL